MRTGLRTRAATRAADRRRLLADGALAVLLAALLLPATVGTIRDGGWSLGLRVTALCVVLIGHVAIATRRLFPCASLGVGGAVALLLGMAPDLHTTGRGGTFSAIFLPSVLIVPVLLYTVATWCAPRISWLALGASGIGAIAVIARLWGADYLTVAQPGIASTDHPMHSWPLFLVLAVVVMLLAPWLLGRYRRLRLLYVAELEDRARRDEADRAAAAHRAAQEERQRIAREMHDVVSHSLAVMVNQAEGGRLVSERDPQRAARTLDTIAGVGRDAMADMRGLLNVLHDSEQAGDRSTESRVPAPQPTLEVLPDLLAQVRRTGLAVTLAERGARQRLCATADLAAYRVVQEALTNVLKHAGPGAGATVTLEWEPSALEITVANRLASDAARDPGPGRGLRGMDDRVRALGGTTRISSDESEFRVTATLPTEVGAP